MDKTKILLVDDEVDLLRGCHGFLTAEGYAVVTAASGQEGLAQFDAEVPDVTVVDLKMPGMDGMAVLKRILARDPDAAVLVITGYGTIDKAIAALKAGASDFIQKPFELEALVIAIEQALKARRLKVENRALKQVLATRVRFENIIGKSAAMARVFDLMRKVSDLDAQVLITGESGTGKELVARGIHAHSARREMPFLALNCGGMPESLVESELFGHVKGAFTDAKQDRTGLIEHAHGGTFFLDEIGELPMSLQVKFLRVLEDHQIRKVGSNREVEIDMRLICATNQDLKALIAKGAFREDLFYRINTIEIHLPPLRQRPEDIDLLAHHFLTHFAEAQAKAITGLSRDALSVLRAHSWPGNVRELMHVMEQVVALSDSAVIQRADLPESIVSAASHASVKAEGHLQARVAAYEKQVIRDALEKYAGNITQTAKALGLTRSGLQKKITRLAVR